MNWIGLLAVGLVTWGGLRERRDASDDRPAPARSIADHGVSDGPLTSKDFDALNFGPLVEGMANFLRNRKTTGPLALAVTGAWGSGKSSIMGLLKEGLDAKGFRTVWFNAWHHEEEEQVLAALLETIRLQAVPAWLSLRGLEFRVRLVRQRLRRHWPVVLLGSVACAAVAALLTTWGADGAAWAEDVTHSPWPVLMGKLAVAGTAIAAVWKGLLGLRAFGMDPSRLLASVTARAKLRDLEAQTSFRHRFAQDFKEVTAALKPRTMTVFVDDLDRCEPPQVMEVMRALNFLASSGDCFLIVGMEESAVTNSVAVSLKAHFEELEGRELQPAEKVRKRWDYAEKWMEKLLQIRVPVPSPDDDQFKALLRGAPTDRQPEWRDWLDSSRAWAAHAWERSKPFAALITVAGLSAAAYLGVGHMLQSNAERSAARTGETEISGVLWPSDSVIDPRLLSHIILESPQGIAGGVLLTNANLTDWMATQNWILRFQFSPEPPVASGEEAPPVIVTPPSNVRIREGDEATFRVEVRGTEPLSFQWQFNEADMIGQTYAHLTLTSVQETNVGSYVVVVTNSFGSVTSQPPAILILLEDDAPLAGVAEPTRPVVVEPGQTDRGPWWVPLLFLVGLLGYGLKRLVDHLDRPVEDSEDFRDALERWRERITQAHKTPRAVKRFVNKLRFYSMMMRALQTAGEVPGVPENAIVAFGVLENHITDGQLPSEHWPDDEALGGDVVALVASLGDYPALFRCLRGSVKVALDGEESPQA